MSTTSAYDETVLARIVTAQIYAHLTFPEIAALLTLAYSNGTHREQYLGLPKRTYTTQTVRNAYTTLLRRHRTPQARQNYLRGQSLLLKSQLIRELVHIKAGLDRMKKPIEEQKGELSWFEYVQSLALEEIDEAKEWARGKAGLEPEW
jgi:hypothetical protein